MAKVARAGTLRAASTVRELHGELLRSADLRDNLLNWLPMARELSPKRRASTTAFIRQIRSDSKLIGFDQATFKSVLDEYLGRLDAIARSKPATTASGRPVTSAEVFVAQKPYREIQSFLDAHIAAVRKKIAAVPKSPEKARDFLRALALDQRSFGSDQTYDALVLLANEATNEIIDEIINNWRQERARADVRFRSAFWTSRDHMERYDDLSRYRLHERFEIAGFDTAFSEVEAGFASGISPHEAGDVRDVAFPLWMVSRTRNIPLRWPDAVRFACKYLCSTQREDGSWLGHRAIVDPTDKGLVWEEAPTAEVTALASAALMKLSSFEGERARAERGVKWLLEHQQPGGDWAEETRTGQKISRRSDLFATVVAIEALSRSTERGARRVIEQALRWLIAQQDDIGEWRVSYLPWPLPTVLALECFEMKDRTAYRGDHYFEMGIGFLRRSTSLANEDSGTSRRLGVIAAAQGLEALCYSLLAHLQENFWDGTQTIGLRKAVSKLQTALQARKTLKPNESVKFRGSIDTLAHYRDEIVHKSIEISASMALAVVLDAQRFADEYVPTVLGFSVPW
jgi:hypothetical protein